MVVWWFFGVWTRTRTRVVPRSPFCILERQIFITNVQKRGLKFDLFSVLYKTGLQTSPRLGNGTRNSIYSPRPGNRFVSFMHACGARFPILCLFKSFWVKHRYQCLATNHGSVLVYQIMLSPCSSWVVPPAGEHPQSDFFDFFVLENHCQNDCKISSKTESKWLHENVKYDKKLQNGSEKETSRKHAHKIHENQENTCLESLIFMSSLVRNRSFHFSRFV